ncbi:TPA: hypothetical protein U7F59_002005 [Streptococcus agalactiae]|uniref:hypothetical protein n=1 Tax=Streptococcus agalactiae TaxID=1311 RepID=UPI0002BB2566|nr:hypothetical protein [Streptococcus agalactiae]EPV33404.1 hypothetical protein SAG0339_04400 [Streptococcus agalactiae GB00679]EPX31794.1 hypothetical protein SAG0088_07395 [Streptococcus agalactiae LMG 15092]MCC9684066.1 hypothetical protein [Streptococcus agalactiae]MCC9695113.1 hypothetical protein [Streptococcus agalactiae]MCC9921878.1 hypothetical protein [Streptococcus agalactiae]
MNLTGMELQTVEWVAYSPDTQEKVLIKPEDCKDLDNRELYRLIKGTGFERLIESRALQILNDFLNQKIQVN